eukprot:jgi/Mesvir1/14852/Mv05470-RA.1
MTVFSRGSTGRDAYPRPPSSRNSGGYTRPKPKSAHSGYDSQTTLSGPYVDLAEEFLRKWLSGSGSSPRRGLSPRALARSKAPRRQGQAGGSSSRPRGLSPAALARHHKRRAGAGTGTDSSLGSLSDAIDSLMTASSPLSREFAYQTYKALPTPRPYTQQDIRLLAEILQQAELMVQDGQHAASSQDERGEGGGPMRRLSGPAKEVTLYHVLQAYNRVLPRHGISPSDDTFYYRFLLKLSLNADEPSWWRKFDKECLCNQRRLAAFTHYSSSLLRRSMRSLRGLLQERIHRRRLADHVEPSSLVEPLEPWVERLGMASPTRDASVLRMPAERDGQLPVGGGGVYDYRGLTGLDFTMPGGGLPDLGDLLPGAGPVPAAAGVAGGPDASTRWATLDQFPQDRSWSGTALFDDSLRMPPPGAPGGIGAGGGLGDPGAGATMLGGPSIFGGVAAMGAGIAGGDGLGGVPGRTAPEMLAYAEFKALAQGFRLWRGQARELRAERIVRERAVRNWTRALTFWVSSVIPRFFYGWKHFRSRKDQAALRRWQRTMLTEGVACLQRWMQERQNGWAVACGHQQKRVLAGCFAELWDAKNRSQQMTAVLQAALSIILLRRCLRGWQRKAERRAWCRVVVGQALARILNRAASAAFFALADHAANRKHWRQVQRDVALDITTGLLSRVMAAWHHQAQRQRRLRRLGVLLGEKHVQNIKARGLHRLWRYADRKIANREKLRDWAVRRRRRYKQRSLESFNRYRQSHRWSGLLIRAMRARHRRALLGRCLGALTTHAREMRRAREMVAASIAHWRMELQSKALLAWILLPQRRREAKLRLEGLRDDMGHWKRSRVFFAWRLVASTMAMHARIVGVALTMRETRLAEVVVDHWRVVAARKAWSRHLRERADLYFWRRTTLSVVVALMGAVDRGRKKRAAAQFCRISVCATALTAWTQHVAERARKKLLARTADAHLALVRMIAALDAWREGVVIVKVKKGVERTALLFFSSHLQRKAMDGWLEYKYEQAAFREARAWALAFWSRNLLSAAFALWLDAAVTQQCKWRARAHYFVRAARRAMRAWKNHVKWRREKHRKELCAIAFWGLSLQLRVLLAWRGTVVRHRRREAFLARLGVRRGWALLRTTFAAWRRLVFAINSLRTGTLWLERTSVARFMRTVLRAWRDHVRFLAHCTRHYQRRLLDRVVLGWYLEARKAKALRRYLGRWRNLETARAFSAWLSFSALWKRLVWVARRFEKPLLSISFVTWKDHAGEHAAKHAVLRRALRSWTHGTLKAAFASWYSMAAWRRYMRLGYTRRVGAWATRRLRVVMEAWSEYARYQRGLKHLDKAAGERATRERLQRGMTSLKEHAHLCAYARAVICQLLLPDLARAFRGWCDYVLPLRLRRAAARRCMAHWMRPWETRVLNTLAAYANLQVYTRFLKEQSREVWTHKLLSGAWTAWRRQQQVWRHQRRTALTVVSRMQGVDLRAVVRRWQQNAREMRRLRAAVVRCGAHMRLPSLAAAFATWRMFPALMRRMRYIVRCWRHLRLGQVFRRWRDLCCTRQEHGLLLEMALRRWVFAPQGAAFYAWVRYVADRRIVVQRLGAAVRAWLVWCWRGGHLLAAWRSWTQGARLRSRGRRALLYSLSAWKLAPTLFKSMQRWKQAVRDLAVHRETTTAIVSRWRLLPTSVAFADWKRLCEAMTWQRGVMGGAVRRWQQPAVSAAWNGWVSLVRWRRRLDGHEARAAKFAAGATLRFAFATWRAVHVRWTRLRAVVLRAATMLRARGMALAFDKWREDTASSRDRRILLVKNLARAANPLLARAWDSWGAFLSWRSLASRALRSRPRRLLARAMRALAEQVAWRRAAMGVAVRLTCPLLSKAWNSWRWLVEVLLPSERDADSLRLRLDVQRRLEGDRVVGKLPPKNPRRHALLRMLAYAAGREATRDPERGLLLGLAFEGWLTHHTLCRRIKRIVVAGWEDSSLRLALVRWSDYAAERARTRVNLQRVTGRCARDLALAQTAHRFLCRMRYAKLIASLNTWRAFVAHKRHSRAIRSSAMAFLWEGLARAGLDAFRTQVSHARSKRLAAHVAYTSLHRRALCGLREGCRTSRAERHALSVALRYWSQSTLDRSFLAWAAAAELWRASREKKAIAMAYRSRKLLRAVFGHWTTWAVVHRPWSIAKRIALLTAATNVLRRTFPRWRAAAAATAAVNARVQSFKLRSLLSLLYSVFARWRAVHRRRMLIKAFTAARAEERDERRGAAWRAEYPALLLRAQVILREWQRLADINMPRKRAALATLSLWRHGPGPLSCLSTWRQTTADCNAMRSCLVRWRRPRLHRAFSRWAARAGRAAHIKGLLLVSSCRLRAHRLSRGLQALAQFRLASVTARDVLFRWRNTRLDLAFARWVESARARQGLRAAALGALVRWTCPVLAAAFASWREAVAPRDPARGALRVAVGRWRCPGALGRGFRGLRAKVQELQRARSCLFRAVCRWRRSDTVSDVRFNNVAAAFAKWREENEGEGAVRRRMRGALRTMMSVAGASKRAAFNGWAAWTRRRRIVKGDVSWSFATCHRRDDPSVWLWAWHCKAAYLGWLRDLAWRGEQIVTDSKTSRLLQRWRQWAYWRVLKRTVALRQRQALLGMAFDAMRAYPEQSKWETAVLFWEIRLKRRSFTLLWAEFKSAVAARLQLKLTLALRVKSLLRNWHAFARERSAERTAADEVTQGRLRGMLREWVLLASALQHRRQRLLSRVTSGWLWAAEKRAFDRARVAQARGILAGACLQRCFRWWAVLVAERVEGRRRSLEARLAQEEALARGKLIHRQRQLSLLTAAFTSWWRAAHARRAMREIVLRKRTLVLVHAVATWRTLARFNTELAAREVLAVIAVKRHALAWSLRRWRARVEATREGRRQALAMAESFAYWSLLERAWGRWRRHGEVVRERAGAVGRLLDDVAVWEERQLARDALGSWKAFREDRRSARARVRQALALRARQLSLMCFLRWSAYARGSMRGDRRFSSGIQQQRDMLGPGSRLSTTNMSHSTAFAAGQAPSFTVGHTPSMAVGQAQQLQSRGQGYEQLEGQLRGQGLTRIGARAVAPGQGPQQQYQQAQHAQELHLSYQQHRPYPLAIATASSPGRRFTADDAGSPSSFASSPAASFLFVDDSGLAGAGGRGGPGAGVGSGVAPATRAVRGSLFDSPAASPSRQAPVAGSSLAWGGPTGTGLAGVGTSLVGSGLASAGPREQGQEPRRATWSVADRLGASASVGRPLGSQSREPPQGDWSQVARYVLPLASTTAGMSASVLGGDGSLRQSVTHGRQDYSPHSGEGYEAVEGRVRAGSAQGLVVMDRLSSWMADVSVESEELDRGASRRVEEGGYLWPGSGRVTARLVDARAESSPAQGGAALNVVAARGPGGLVYGSTGSSLGGGAPGPPVTGPNMASMSFGQGQAPTSLLGTGDRERGAESGAGDPAASGGASAAVARSMYETPSVGRGSGGDVSEWSEMVHSGRVRLAELSSRLQARKSLHSRLRHAS